MIDWIDILEKLSSAFQGTDGPDITVPDMLAYLARTYQTSFPLAFISVPPTQKIIILKTENERTVVHNDRKLGSLILCQTFLKPLISHIEYNQRDTTRCIIWIPEDPSQRIFVIISQSILV